MLQQLIDKICEQQQGKENTDVFMVGEQLKDICRNSPDAVEIVLQDLDIPEMGIDKAARKIKEHADELKKNIKGNCVCVPPNVAENVIKEFYGIKEIVNSKTFANLQEESRKTADFIDLKDFI